MDGERVIIKSNPHHLFNHLFDPLRTSVAQLGIDPSNHHLELDSNQFLILKKEEETLASTRFNEKPEEFRFR